MLDRCLQKRRVYGRAPGTCAQANTPRNKTHQEFQADGRLWPQTTRKQADIWVRWCLFWTSPRFLTQVGDLRPTWVNIRDETRKTARCSASGAVADCVCALMAPFAAPAPMNWRSVLLLREEWRRSRPRAAESSPPACVYPCASGPNQISMTTFVKARLEVRQREYRLPLPKPPLQRRNRSLLRNLPQWAFGLAAAEKKAFLLLPAELSGVMSCPVYC